jgi:NAD(P)-dependent dehydrogenase (short-subunit alcohol dehydrogenase family)
MRRFAQQDSNLAFFDIKAGEGQSLARELSDQGLSAHFERVNRNDIAALRPGVAEARDAHGAIDILINNGAHDKRYKTEEMTPEY